MGWKLGPALLVTMVLAAHAPHPAPHRKAPIRMIATAFCQKGPTRSGAPARRGMIAADPRVLPLGSTVRVRGLASHPRQYLVADTGSAVKGRHIDIFMTSCSAAKRFGRRPVLVQTVPADDP